VDAAPTVRLLLFAKARELAGGACFEVPGATVGEVLDGAVARFGADSGELLGCCRVWLDGDEPADGPATPVTPGAEVAVLPPVSGG
jgi:sulfur-carrier protein